MTTTTRQTNLILNQDWTRIYQTFKNADFKMGPNPCHSVLTIDRTRNEEEILIIRDIRGRIVIEEKIVGFKYTIDVAHLNSGVFILSLSENPGNAQKLIID